MLGYHYHGIIEAILLGATPSKDTNKSPLIPVVWDTGEVTKLKTLSTIQNFPTVLRTSDRTIQGKVLECFKGFVSQVEGNTVYVELESLLTGETLYGEHNLVVRELNNFGIEERRSFMLLTFKDESEVAHTIMIPLNPRYLSKQEELEIDREIDKLLAGKDLAGDY